MKLWITLGCIYLFSLSASGQKKHMRISDTAFLRCYYLFTKPIQNNGKGARSDTAILDIGSRISRFYDPARLGRDSLIYTRMKNIDPGTIKTINVYRGEAAKNLSGMPGTTSSSTMEGESYQIIKDRSASKITVLDYVDPIGDRFAYQDDIGVLPWEISDVTDTVSSYYSQKATLHFRGRDYVAWFTTDISVNEGPWKFSGLPGLILKIEDTRGLFSFKLIGLQQLSPALPILIDDSKNIKCTRAAFEKLKKKQGAGMQININSGNMIIAETPGEASRIQMELQ